MTVLPALAALLLVGIALAGCTASPPENGDQPGPTGGPDAPGGTPPPSTGNNTTDPGATQPPTVHVFQGSIAGVATPDPASLYLTLGGGDHVFEFDVPEGATGIVIEVAWNATDALHLLVDAPSEYCSSDDPSGLMMTCPDVPDDTDGGSPAVVRVTDAALLNLTGTWQLGVWAPQSPQPVEFTAYASVFLGAAPDPAYSAVGSAPSA